MVLKLLGSVVGLVKVRQLHTDVDNNIFRLHYRWTTTLCYICCALVAASDYIGNAIQCIEGSGNPVPKAFNTYCWIKSTYTINSTKSDHAHYGSGTYNPAQHTVTYHAYYQWVPFFLFFQGCVFYLPHLLWKSFEGKMADSLLQGLQFNAMDDDREQKKENIVKYLKASWGRNTRYSVAYLVCEAFNFVNVILQMFLLDKFLGGVFMKYGSEVVNFALNDDDTRHDPMTATFPRVTKCDFYTTGPSGTLQKLDGMCILPQNILNEKIFIVMWFWFIILATVTAMQLAWRIAVSVSPVVRIKMLEQRGKFPCPPAVDQFIRRLQLGDYFLLDIMGRNLDALNFKDILMKVSEAVEDRNGSYKPFYEVDDDDPLAMKRQMEREESTSV